MARRARGSVREGRLLRQLGTALGTLVGGVVLGAAAGATWQLLASWKARRRYSPPGRLVDIGGHRLHVRVAGEGSPTVVLEAGLTATSAVWGWIEPALAEVTRVVAYDRAGIGWSESSLEPHDGLTVARHLAVLLDRLGSPGPVVLVGHSMGGLFVRIFADLHPERVAGMVLIDPSHPDQLERFPAEGVRLQKDFWGQLRVAPILAGLGVYRLTGGMKAAAAGLPDESLVDAEVFFSSVHHFRGVKGEMLAWDETVEQVRRSRPLGDLPLLVLSASRPAGDLLQSFQLLHEDLSRLSSRGEHRIIEDSDHYTLLTDANVARVTTDAILEIVRAARSGRPASSGGGRDSRGGRRRPAPRG